MRFYSYVVLFLTLICLPVNEANAAFRGGGGGGARVRSTTTVRTGAGVTRSTTVAAGRYHRPTTLPARTPGVAYRGAAVRTTTVVRNGNVYRSSTGYAYRYGRALVALPYASCYAVMWQGISAYNCNGIMYVNQNSSYYAIEGV
jgi:hypothetical protein